MNLFTSYYIQHPDDIIPIDVNTYFVVTVHDGS